jgi:Zn-dependent protease
MKKNWADYIFNRRMFFGLLSLFFYSWIVGWAAGTLILVAIGYHELCHLWAAKKLGLKTDGFYFIPMMGGVSFVNDKYKTDWQKAQVVLAGPLLGSLLVIPIYLLYLFTGHLWFAAAAIWVLWVNTFNLVPLGLILDGSQILDIITYSINKKLGFILRIVSVLVGIVVISQFNFILGLLIGWIGGTSIGKELKNNKYLKEGRASMCSDDFLHPPIKLSFKQRLIVSGVWVSAFSLMCVCYYCIKHITGMNYVSVFEQGS